MKDGKGYIREFYEFGIIKFEGEFLNGEKNGKGKEYDILCGLIFEGEYLNNKKNGKGKEYQNGELIFEGEYINDKRNKGKEYIKVLSNTLNEPLNLKKFKKNDLNISDELNEAKYIIKVRDKLKSDYINEKSNGKGKIFSGNKLIFEGEYLYGKKWRGKEYYNNKLIFEGKYLYNYRKEGKE